ncbi:hypothetical protein C7212DRAFT_366195 [Tuber magnatum]|uniref:Nephrocystin 3-like N-terminal domain-containing protein n=1 Tax=Tuber magnatum TaxID=42249 RepID=A0A317SG57_9PEZI|nr:hypothetical protein C7212DRAFT_366195 [Tuber magnatum]
MSDQQSSTPFEDPSTPQRNTSRLATDSNVQGDFSGNSGSNNQFNSGNTSTTTNNNYYNRQDTDSSQNYAKILQCLYSTRLDTSPTEIAFVIQSREHVPGSSNIKNDSEEQRSANFALCAILHQLFVQRKDLYPYAEQEFVAKGKKFADEVDTLWKILVRAAAESGCAEVICVLDALDECEEVTLAALIRHVNRLSRSRPSGIVQSDSIVDLKTGKRENELVNHNKE